MKLRIRGDSLRLRVVRAELDALVAGGAVEERMRLPGGGALVYRLVVGDDPERFDVRHEIVAAGAGARDSVITVGLPVDAARRWFAPAEVGLRGEVPLAGEARLSLLVEKDFPCLTDRPGEDDRDAFPWPGKSGA